VRFFETQCIYQGGLWGHCLETTRVRTETATNFPNINLSFKQNVASSLVPGIGQRKDFRYLNIRS